MRLKNVTSNSFYAVIVNLNLVLTSLKKTSLKCYKTYIG